MPSSLFGSGIIPGTNATSSLAKSLIDFNTSGDNTLQSGVANQTIRVYRLFLIVGGSTNIIFKSGANGLTGTLPMSANGGITLDLTLPLEPWFNTNTGESFILNSSSAVQIGGLFWFQQS